MKVQVVGFGGLGRNLLRLINEKNGLVREAIGENIDVVSVSDSTGTVITDDMPLTRIIEAKESKGLKALESFEKIGAIRAIKDIDADLVVEVTHSTNDGHPGIDHVLTAFDVGKEAVTANKGILISEPNMIKTARERKKNFKYEATVCGGIPVFNLIDNSIKASKISMVEGIFNATSSFVVSKIEEGETREEAIDYARKIGLAERNPNDDLKGIDSARKGTILHRRIFGSDLTIKDADINYSPEGLAAGHRLVTQVDEGGVKVEYRKLREGDIFRNVKGASMIIRFTTDIYDHLTLFTDHDGPMESAAAVFNDILLVGKEREKI